MWSMKWHEKPHGFAYLVYIFRKIRRFRLEDQARPIQAEEAGARGHVLTRTGCAEEMQKKLTDRSEFVSGTALKRTRKTRKI